jgi:hypothetical protein
MRFGVHRQQTLLLTTEHVIWRYANAFIFTNQSELDFRIAYVAVEKGLTADLRIKTTVYHVLYLLMAYIQPLILNEYLQRQMTYDESELPLPLLVWIQL